MKHAYAAVAVLAFAHAAQAEYSFFNPVPDDKLRPYSTERPSKTDSAVTVDAGRYQLETSVVNYVRNDDCVGGACSSSREWGLGAFNNLRIGLTPSADLQLIVDAYRNVNSTDRTTGAQTHATGFGDTTVRYKYNFWGNDGGKSALAGMVYTKLPTNSDKMANDAVEGGIEFPFSLSLNETWTLGGMTQFNILNEQGSARDYYGGYVNALYLSRGITDMASGYVEFYTFLPDTGGRDWQNTLDFGVIQKLNDHSQIDGGMNVGVTNAAPDVQLFAGYAYRF